MAVPALWETEHGSAEIDVTADHPAFLPASVRMTVPHPLDAQRENVRVLSFALELIPAARLRGSVVDKDGVPLSGVAVAAFVGNPTGGGAVPGSTVITGPTGEYALRVALRKNTSLVATQAGMRPAVAHVSGASQLLPDLVLESGARVNGAVRGLDGRLLPGVEVIAEPAEAPDIFYVGPHPLSMEAGRPEWGCARTTTDQAGRYEIAGLPEGPCTVRIDSIEGTSILPGLLRTWLVRTRAPAATIDFHLGGCILDIQCLSEGDAVRNARIEFLDQDGFALPVHDDGRLEVLARPLAPHRLRVVEPGHEVWEAEVTTAGDGERVRVTIELERLGRRGMVTLLLENPEGPVPEWIRVSASRVDVSTSPVAMGSRDVSGADGQFVIEYLGTGRYQLSIRVDAGRDGATRYLLDEELVVDVPRSGERTVRVSLRLGGRIRIVCRAEEGQYAPAACEVWDVNGRRVEAVFSGASPNGSLIEARGELIAGGPSSVEPVLIPGRHKVRCEMNGHLAAEVEVDVEVGRTKTVEISMKRE